MAKIKFKIVTPERVVFEQEVNQVTLPTQTGQITVLPHHIPLLSALSAGELVIKTDKEEIFLAVSGGLVEVKPGNEVIILTENAETAQEIDEARAKEAHRRAIELMKEKHREEVDYTALAAKIEKELARLKVARRRQPPSHQPTIQSE